MQHLKRPNLDKQRNSAFLGAQHENDNSDFGLESGFAGLTALRVLGDAMAPRILDGDIAFIAQEASVQNGEIAAVSVDGGRAEICRLLWQGGGILLCPQNLQFPMRFFPAQEALRLRVLGRVVKAVRNL